MEIEFVTDPKTKSPDATKPYVAVMVGGEEKWILLATDSSDGVTDADFDFGKGKDWAEAQKSDGK